MTEMLTLALIDALLRPLLLVTLTACVLVSIAVARDMLAKHHDDLPDWSCGRCGEGFAHPNDIRDHTCAPSPLTRLLTWLGMRSECCGARTYQPTGWDRTYCAQCDRRLS